MSQVSIACDGDWSEPEVQISGTVNAFRVFGELLNSISRSMVLEAAVVEDKFYPVTLRLLILELEKSITNGLKVEVDKEKLTLKGSVDSFKKMGESLLNFFDENTTDGEHFHLNYFEGNEILDKTECHLIFVCEIGTS